VREEEALTGVEEEGLVTGEQELVEGKAVLIAAYLRANSRSCAAPSPR
jgi:hypothetical protein